MADDVNALFHQNDTGVIMHVLDLTEDSHNPWLACLSESDDCLSWKPYGRLSFLIMNQLSWNEAAKAINTFGDLSSVGYIGTEEVTRDLVRCIFPGDGGTMQRSHEGCGCIALHPESCSSLGWDWCTPNALWDGVCTMKPDELQEMLAQFKKGGFPYNEAVVDGEEWNRAVGSSLRAFIVPSGPRSSCDVTSDCYKTFTTWYSRFEALHGRKTILTFDASNEEKPFAPFQQEESTDVAFV